MPEQYVLISFDACVELESWTAWSDFCRRHPDIRLTFFVSGSCFLNDSMRTLYRGPGHAPGAARIKFGGSLVETKARAAHLNAVFRAGHEIASHAAGHFDGAAWTAEEWLEEFGMFDALLDGFAANNGFAGDADLAFGSQDIRGFRAPFLSAGPGLGTALAKRCYLYDATLAGRAGEWPRTDRDGVWRFKLASIPLPGYRRTPLSMDYNLFYAQSEENPEIFADEKRLEETVVEAYLNYFKRNYLTNRAPIHIGHHFTDYRGTVYRRALMRFIALVCDRPDVRLITYSELATRLARSTEKRVEAAQ